MNKNTINYFDIMFVIFIKYILSVYKLETFLKNVNLKIIRPIFSQETFVHLSQLAAAMRQENWKCKKCVGIVSSTDSGAPASICCDKCGVVSHNAHRAEESTEIRSSIAQCVDVLNACILYIYKCIFLAVNVVERKKIINETKKQQNKTT